ncbi:hypothetical protein DIPPA_25857 [Diplonema papillatum]|nr:hypothetical protein DIPPA_25857 [Diplonema papillatum]
MRYGLPKLLPVDDIEDSSEDEEPATLSAMPLPPAAAAAAAKPATRRKRFLSANEQALLQAADDDAWSGALPPAPPVPAAAGAARPPRRPPIDSPQFSFDEVPTEPPRGPVAAGTDPFASWDAISVPLPPVPTAPPPRAAAEEPELDFGDFFDVDEVDENFFDGADAAPGDSPGGGPAAAEETRAGKRVLLGKPLLAKGPGPDRGGERVRHDGGEAAPGGKDRGRKGGKAQPVRPGKRARVVPPPQQQQQQQQTPGDAMSDSFFSFDPVSAAPDAAQAPGIAAPPVAAAAAARNEAPPPARVAPVAGGAVAAAKEPRRRAPSSPATPAEPHAPRGPAAAGLDVQKGGGAGSGALGSASDAQKGGGGGGAGVAPPEPALAAAALRRRVAPRPRHVGHPAGGLPDTAFVGQLFTREGLDDLAFNLAFEEAQLLLHIAHEQAAAERPAKQPRVS